jgi:chromosome segregation ATPase
LHEPIVIYQGMILDGRNRYRACLAAGFTPSSRVIWERPHAAKDPIAYVISQNIHRRHLTGEQKREAIDKLLAAKPELSDRQIAKMAKVDHKTVATVRQAKEARGEIPHVEKRADTKGRKQPARKAEAVKQPKAKPSKAEAVTEMDAGPVAIVTGSDVDTSAAKQPESNPSKAEVDRLFARINELHAEKRRLELKIVGLESEVEELKLENAQLRKKLAAGGTADTFEAAKTRFEAAIETFGKGLECSARPSAPADDGLDIPPCLLRTAPPATNGGAS